MTMIPAGGFPQNQPQGNPVQVQGTEPSMQYSPQVAIDMARAAMQPQQQQAQQPNTAPQTQNLQNSSAMYAQMNNPQMQNQPLPGTQPQQQQFQQQPQYQQQQLPQTQQLPPAPPQQPGNLNQRIAAGPGVPPQLVGRTMGEVVQLFGSMQAALGQQQQQQQPPQAQPRPAQPQQPTTQQGANFWANPEQVIQQTVQRTAQQIQMPQMIERAAGSIANLPQDAELQTAIVGYLQGLDDAALTNPRAWQVAYNAAVGERYMQGRAVQAQPQGQQQAQQVQRPQPGFNQMNSGQNYVPASGQFFTESPGPGNNPAVPVLTDLQRSIARKFNMTDQMYAAMGGVLNGGR